MITNTLLTRHVLTSEGNIDTDSELDDLSDAIEMALNAALEHLREKFPEIQFYMES